MIQGNEILYRVLIVHNSYQHRGGEDSVADAEAELLRGRGHEVEIYSRHNDEIHSMPVHQLVQNTLWSSRTTQEIHDVIRKFKPDVIHVHNTFPLISPSIYWEANRLNVPVVQTLHNFRLLCPQAMFLRHGKVCEDCLGHVPWRGVVRGCYKDSKAQSAVLGGMLMLHKSLGTYRKKIARYIALNEFCRQKFIAGGLPADHIEIKPNFVDFPAPQESFREGFLFVGRLSAEKGLSVLVDAMKLQNGFKLTVAGSGPQDDLIQGTPGITALGGIPIDQVRIQMGQSLALVLPSVWYENFPRTLVEAFACGLPVIASRIGAIEEIVEEGVTGLLFEPGNSKDLAEKMSWARQNPERLLQMSKNARKKYEAEYTAQENYKKLISIYRDAISDVETH